MFGRNKFSNYLNTTSNRVESFNLKLKTIQLCQKNFTDLTIFLSLLTSEKNLKATITRMREKLQRIFDDVQHNYHNYCRYEYHFLCTIYPARQKAVCITPTLKLLMSLTLFY